MVASRQISPHVSFRAAKILFICDLRFILAHQNDDERYMKRFRLMNLLLPMLAVWSCTDDWKFSADKDYVLEFSADTVCFDTVFAGVASASAQFMIYNQNDMGIRFDALMGAGTSSPFRMNLDGEGGAVITGLEIPAHDSLFCFVSVNMEQTGQPDIMQAPMCVKPQNSFRAAVADSRDLRQQAASPQVALPLLPPS